MNLRTFEVYHSRPSHQLDQMEVGNSFFFCHRSHILTLFFFEKKIIESSFHLAIIHYSPDPNDCDIIKKDQVWELIFFKASNDIFVYLLYEFFLIRLLQKIYLCDSGG